jgi:hypothetical protein
VTENNDAGRLTVCNWNEGGVKHPTSNDWRASLVPAAAVIPAPIAYIRIEAVKTLVVEVSGSGSERRMPLAVRAAIRGRGSSNRHPLPLITLKKIECSRQASAWIC